MDLPTCLTFHFSRLTFETVTIKKKGDNYVWCCNNYR